MISISERERERETHTYTISRSHSAQIFWPVGRPPVVGGGAGRSTGARTCFVTGVTAL